MLVSIVMSVSLLFVYERNRTIGLLLVSLIFFVYGVSVRHIAIFCALPFFFYVCSITIGTKGFRRTAASVSVPRPFRRTTASS